MCAAQAKVPLEVAEEVGGFSRLMPSGTSVLLQGRLTRHPKPAAKQACPLTARVFWLMWGVPKKACMRTASRSMTETLILAADGTDSHCIACCVPMRYHEYFLVIILLIS